MDLPRTSGRETNTRGWIAVPRSNCRSRLCVQHVDGNCEEARADVRGCSSRNASPHAEVMAGRKSTRRGRANGAGRNRTGYSRTLATILAELASKIFQVDVFPAHGRVPTNLAEVTER